MTSFIRFYLPKPSSTILHATDIPIKDRNKSVQLLFFQHLLNCSLLSLTDSIASFRYTKLGCFKDAQARAIPSLEGQDPPVLDGNSTTRKDASRKCALAAKRRGHKVSVVMTDGQCASGPNTTKNFAKFGYGVTECSLMTVSNDVYIFGYQDVDGMIFYYYLVWKQRLLISSQKNVLKLIPDQRPTFLLCI